MIEWADGVFSSLVKHYKEMTAVAVIISILKFYPVLFYYLNKRLEKNSRRDRIKIWTDAGYSQEQAEAMIDDHFSFEKRQSWLIRFVKRLMPKIKNKKK